MNLRTELEQYGISSRSVKLFDKGASPELLDYLDLAEPADEKIKAELMPGGVAEIKAAHSCFLSTRAASLSPWTTPN